MRIGLLTAALLILPMALSASGLKDEFPLGVYWAWPHNSSNAASAGVDVDTYLERSMATLRAHNCDAIWIVNGPYDDSAKFLDLCEKHSIKALLPTVFVEMYYQGFNGDLGVYEKHAENTVRQIGEKKALMGYVLKDEPRLNSLQQTDYFHQLLKRADKQGRDSVVVAITSDIQTYVEDTSLPVLCTDVYLFGGSRSTVMPNTPRKAQMLYRATCENAVSAAMRKGKHMWIMPQCFGDVWGWNWWDKNKRHWMEKGSYVHWRLPTVNEVRWQAWEAVRCGAKGVMFFLANPKSERTKADISPGGKDYDWMKRHIESVMKQPFLKDRSNLEPERAELPREQGLMHIGGKPTESFKALGEAYGKIAKAKRFLLKAERSPFPAFFAADEFVKTATFSVPGADDFMGVIVNDDLEQKRVCRVYMVSNVDGVKEIGGSQLRLSNESAQMRYFELTLEPGGGAVVVAKFANNRPGMQLLHEDFMRHLYKGKAAEFVERRENIACNNRGIGDLVYKKGAAVSSAPAFTISNLTNPKTANNTFFLNLNSSKRQGNIWLYVDAKGVSVEAILDKNAKEQKTDTLHLEANGMRVAEEEKAVDAKNKSLELVVGLPVQIPVGTTGLEFRLDAHDSYMREINIWFTPLIKGE